MHSPLALDQRHLALDPPCGIVSIVQGTIASIFDSAILCSLTNLLNMSVVDSEVFPCAHNLLEFFTQH